MFKDEAKTTVKSILRVRRMLLQKRIGNQSTFVVSAFERTERLMQTYQYNSDELMARFLIIHANDLAAIIPGYRSKCSHRLSEQLYTLINQSYQILTTNAKAIS